MAKNILIIQGNPDSGSLCDSLAELHLKGLKVNQHRLKRLTLRDLDFDLVAHPHTDKPLETDLQNAQELIRWAHHIVLVYPIWWGTMPALVKGFIDRTLTDGFALQYQSNGFPKPLLKGKTLQILNTTDTPGWLQWFILRPDLLLQRRNIWGFCGIKVIGHQRYGSITHSQQPQRAKWLAHAERLGQQFR